MINYDKWINSINQRKILIIDNRYTLDNFACFIFAGGKGKRLWPLSKKIPKPLIKIENKSLIEMIINVNQKVKT